jgi:phage tail sheath protein FI
VLDCLTKRTYRTNKSFEGEVLMTELRNRSTPGVYIRETNAFGTAIVGVPTAVPAFIGYTEKAEINGKPVSLQAIKIGSLTDFQHCFGGKFKPIYDIVQQHSPKDNNYDFSVELQNTSAPIPSASPSPPSASTSYFYTKQTSASEFNLYDSMLLFYANGGGDCFVVSVGTYTQKINDSDLLNGVKVINEEVGPTMLVIPDAVLLPADASPSGQIEHLGPPYYEPYRTSQAFQNVTRAMLTQCWELQDRVAILDVYSTLSVDDQASLDQVINQFHVDVGSDPSSYGMAYFPFLHTTLVQSSDFDYTNINSDSQALLQQILNSENKRLYYDSDPPTYEQLSTLIKGMFDAATNVTGTNHRLIVAIPLLNQIEQAMLERNSALPPSAAIAGVYNLIDGTVGIWNAPANKDLIAVTNTTYELSDEQQGAINVPLDGKSVNALREFPGRGTVVWGARTLDGNSSDWRYIPVRRTIIYIEQSIKSGLNQLVFAPNDDKTWVVAVAILSNFLEQLWQQGGLMGDKASDAFSVQCGLGSTMTAPDILEGYMIVQVTLQMIHPAEYIALTFKQKMQSAAR